MSVTDDITLQHANLNLSKQPPHPYASSIASSASSSSSSVFSSVDYASSQCSLPSSSASSVEVIWENDQATRLPTDGSRKDGRGGLPSIDAVAPELRRNPRRTHTQSVRPTLMRQCERNINFVDNLVGKTIIYLFVLFFYPVLLLNLPLSAQTRPPTSSKPYGLCQA